MIQFQSTHISINRSVFSISLISLSVLVKIYSKNNGLGTAELIVPSHSFSRADLENNLNFRFYIYDEPIFRWWDNCTNDVQAKKYSVGQKHGDDVLFYPHINTLHHLGFGSKTGPSRPPF